MLGYKPEPYFTEELDLERMPEAVREAYVPCYLKLLQAERRHTERNYDTEPFDTGLGPSYLERLVEAEEALPPDDGNGHQHGFKKLL